MATMHKKSSSRVSVKCPSCNEVFLPSTESKQSRAGASSRRKGQAFERKIAKQLAEWWNSREDIETKFEFKRTPMSGGSALKEGWGLAGDIATTDPEFKFHLELKNQPSAFSGLHNLFSDKSKIWKWMKQAREDCGESGKIPLLVFNRFDQPTYCAVDINDDVDLLERLDRLNIDYFTFSHTYLDNTVSYKITLAIWKFEDLIGSKPEIWL